MLIRYLIECQSFNLTIKNAMLIAENYRVLLVSTGSMLYWALNNGNTDIFIYNCVSQTCGAKARALDIDLNPSRPRHRLESESSGESAARASQLVDCSGQVQVCHCELVSQPLQFYRADPT
jgi:hypothetical protein